MIRLITFICLFTFFLPLSLFSQDKIVLSKIFLDLTNKDIQKFSLLAKYLEENNTQNLKFDIKFTNSHDDAINKINNSEVDIFIDSLSPTLNIKKQTSLRIVSKNWKEGREGYRTIIYTKKDSKINSIEQLNGKKIALEDKYSTSGFYIPKKVIEKHGLKLDTKKSDNSVIYMLASTEENVASKVLFNLVDAGATDDYNYSKLNKNFFKVLYISELIPRSIISFSNTISKENEYEILNVLYSMHESENGRKVLKEFSNSKKISPLSESDIRIITKGI